MYRLLVVDDEPVIRQGLLARLAFLGFSFEKVLEAGDGREALALLRESGADICIVDIQMPEMDGLRFIEQALTLRGGVQFILLSGYAEFAYAERAISLGVSDYLLKPLSNEELYSAMRKAIGALEENARRREVDSSHAYLTRTQENFRFDREINALANEENTPENRDRYPHLREHCPELFGAEGSMLLFGILTIEQDSYSRGRFERADAELLRFSVRNVFSELPSGCVKLIADNLTNMEQMYLVFIGADSMPLREEAERIFYRIYTLFDKRFAVHLSMGVSGCRECLDSTARWEAAEALRWRGGQERLSLCFYADRELPEMRDFPMAELNLLSLFMKRGDLDGMRKSIRRIFAGQPNFRYRAQVSHMLLSRILNMTLLAFPTGEGREERFDELLTGFARAEEIAEPEEMGEQLFAVLLHYIGKELYEAHAEDKIRLAIEYMRQNFASNIAINELAERYGMSPNYFSTMFKKETNQSAITYLTNLRVQKAAWYLENTNDSAVDISQRVGYEDSQYFFRVFKKATGMTPLMYRKEHEKNAKNGGNENNG